MHYLTCMRLATSSCTPAEKMLSSGIVDPAVAHDQQLIHACIQAPDLESRRRLLSELFRRYYLRVHHWCIRFTGNRDTAADVTQEIFLRAHKYFNSFKGDSAFITWLYTIARNCCTDEVHAFATRPQVTSTEFALDIPDERSDSAHRRMEREASARMVYALLENTLSEREIQVFVRHYADELTLDAITKELNLTNTSGAKAYIVSAKRKLSWAIGKPHPPRRTSQN